MDDTGSAKNGKRTEQLHVFDISEFSHHIAVHVGLDIPQIAKVASFRVTRAMGSVQGIIVGSSRIAGFTDVSFLVNVQTML